MNDHFLQAVAAFRDLMEARKQGQFDKVAALRAAGHGCLFAADSIDGKEEKTPIGSSEQENEAADELRRMCEWITAKPFPKIPIGGPRGRNGEILRIALPILLKYLLPILIAEAGPAVASAAIMSLIES